MMKSGLMLRLAAATISLGLGLAPAFADDMSKGAMTKDKMEKSSMSKSDGMSKSKKDGMKKDNAGMKKDNMSSDGMKK